METIGFTMKIGYHKKMSKGSISSKEGGSPKIKKDNKALNFIKYSNKENLLLNSAQDDEEDNANYEYDVQNTIQAANSGSNGKIIEMNEYLSRSNNLINILRESFDYFNKTELKINSSFSINQGKLKDEIQLLKTELNQLKVYNKQLIEAKRTTQIYENYDTFSHIENKSDFKSNSAEYAKSLIDTISKMNAENAKMKKKLQSIEMCVNNNKNDKHYQDMENLLESEIRRMKGLLGNFSDHSSYNFKMNQSNSTNNNHRINHSNYIEQFTRSENYNNKYIRNQNDINEDKLKFNDSYNITNTSGDSDKEEKQGKVKKENATMYLPRPYSKGVTKTAENNFINNYELSKILRTERMIPTAIMNNNNGNINGTEYSQAKKSNYTTRIIHEKNIQGGIKNGVKKK